MEGLDYFFNQIMWVNLFMFIWFHTDAFCDYFKSFDFLKIKDYKKYLDMNRRITYPEYLFLQKQTFFTKLISCKPCSLFWFTIFTSFIFSFSSFASVYVCSYVIYRLLEKQVY